MLTKQTVDRPAPAALDLGPAPLRPWLAVVVPSAVAVAVWIATPDHVIREVIPGGRAGGGAGLIAVALVVAALAGAARVGASLPAPRSVRAATRLDEDATVRLALALGVIALVAQAVWIGLGVLRAGGPGILVALVTGGSAIAAKGRYFATIPGVTTLTQVAPVAVLLALLALRTPGLSPTVRGRARLALALALAPGIVRAFLLAERLAIYEIVIPAVVLLVRDARRPARAAAVVAVLPAALVAVFVVGEANRSFVEKPAPGRLETFATNRLAQYVFTTVNNGVRVIESPDDIRTPATNSLRFVWEVPGVSALAGRDDEFSGGADGSRKLAALDNTGRTHPEFNTIGGAALLFLDFGALSVVAGAVLGWIGGRIYRRFLDGDVTGLLVYPSFVVGLLDFWRALQFGSGRYVPTLAAGLVAAAVLRRSSWHG